MTLTEWILALSYVICVQSMLKVCVNALIVPNTSLPFTFRKKPTHMRVNCWFCNQDTEVPYGNRNCWDCPYCEQYNGFQEVIQTYVNYWKHTWLVNAILNYLGILFKKKNLFKKICRMVTITNQFLRNIWSTSTMECQLAFLCLKPPRLCSG